MTNEQRTKRLRALMTKHELSAPEVAEILQRSAQTVRSWSCKYVQRAIPANQLRLLELELAKRGVASESN